MAFWNFRTLVVILIIGMCGLTTEAITTNTLSTHSTNTPSTHSTNTPSTHSTNTPSTHSTNTPSTHPTKTTSTHSRAMPEVTGSQPSPSGSPHSPPPPPVPQTRLIHHLFGEREYDANSHPTYNASKAVHVTIDLMLSDILHLDNRRQVLQAAIWLRLFWCDEALVWDPAEFGGIRSIMLQPSRVWRPDIVLYNMANVEADDKLELYPVNVKSNGRVAWLYPNVVEATCDIDVRYFPWDNQTCTLLYGSWTQDINSIDLQPKRNVTDVRQYSPNAEYTLLKSPVIGWNDEFDIAGMAPSTMVTFEIHLQRKALYYINTIIAPSIFVSFLAAMVFLVPPGSGEKIGLAITVMLASTVFQLIVADATPVQSDYIPVLGAFFIWMLASLSVTTVMSVIVVCINDNGSFGRPVPGWLKIFAFKILAYICCERKAARDLLQEEEEKGSHKEPINECTIVDTCEITFSDATIKKSSDIDMDSLTSKVDFIMNSLKDMAKRHKNKELDEVLVAQWTLVAKIIDRISFMIFIVLFIGMMLFLMSG